MFIVVWMDCEPIDELLRFNIILEKMSVCINELKKLNMLPIIRVKLEMCLYFEYNAIAAIVIAN